METKVEPTDEGRLRYPPTGIYTGGFYDPEWWEVCTCKSDCPSPCKGSCGCEACRACYNDVLSCE